MAKRTGLGRGLGALIKDTPAAPTEVAAAGGLERVAVTAIDKSPWQPRRGFDDGALEELAASIREQGLIQPVVVRRVRDRYELVAGERRLRAAQRAGLETVPVILIEVGDQEALELALVENLQREDLNIIDEAEGYRQLADRFALTQEQIAERVGKGRATVANALRLLELSEVIRALLVRGELSAGHGKVLLQVEIPKEREHLAHRVVREGISVRELERIVARMKRPSPRRRSASARVDLPREHVQFLTEKLQHHFGTGVRVTPSSTLPNGKKSKGSIEIDFFSNDELDRLLEILGVDNAL